MLEMIEDRTILIPLGIVSGHGRKFGYRQEAGDAAAVAGGSDGGGGGVGRRGLGSAGARIGLAARTGALVEERPVDFGDDKLVGTAEVEGGGGAEGEGMELGLGERGHVYVG